MFNKYFTSAFVDNTNAKSILLIKDSTSNSVISDISLPVQEVQSILEALKPEKATGPDEILARFLKETAPMNASSSTVLFNRSLLEGNIPSEWKLANIVPVHKTTALSLYSASFPKLWNVVFLTIPRNSYPGLYLPGNMDCKVANHT